MALRKAARCSDQARARVMSEISLRLQQEQRLSRDDRERLLRAGIDPDRIGSQFTASAPDATPAPHANAPEAGAPTDNPAHYLGLLEELHDAGVLSDDEYGDARLRLLEQLRG